MRQNTNLSPQLLEFAVVSFLSCKQGRSDFLKGTVMPYGFAIWCIQTDKEYKYTKRNTFTFLTRFFGNQITIHLAPAHQILQTAPSRDTFAMRFPRRRQGFLQPQAKRNGIQAVWYNPPRSNGGGSVGCGMQRAPWGYRCRRQLRGDDLERNCSCTWKAVAGAAAGKVKLL